MDENGMGKFRPELHRIPYKPAVYRFGRKNRNGEKKGKNSGNGNGNRRGILPTVSRLRYFIREFPSVFSRFQAQSSPESPSVSLPAPRAPSRPKPIRLKTHHSPLQCLNPSSVAPRPQPSRASRRRPGKLSPPPTWRPASPLSPPPPPVLLPLPSSP